ncbi:hypothetical protein F6V25_07195 [Oryzomonas japonica]|uniref:Lipoprotein n=1 Tax=Oryzomonas japonica TaxID=2603858 RepID=A0A7J4ZSI2_9BACT|nr:hypothetical protein [Oryzomonas japonica]KAB0666248.1 hypothetical protein F6V25_07195 [Oryzomonas japonica]
MKNHIISTIICTISFLTLAACGGGGGGGQTTQAVTTLYLFGQMSSTTNSKIDSIQTSFVVPTGVLVNYTSAPGAPAGNYPVRAGFAVPSGPIKVAASDISGTYNTGSRLLTISLQNVANPKLALQSYTTAKNGATIKGAEVAKVTLKLVTPGSTPTYPSQDLFATIWQYRELPSIYLGLLDGSHVNFDTKFQ